MSLWSSDDVSRWSEALSAYAQTIEAHGKPRLVELDRWASRIQDSACKLCDHHIQRNDKRERCAMCYLRTRSTCSLPHRFYTKELPKLIAGREPPHVTAAELVQVVKLEHHF